MKSAFVGRVAVLKCRASGVSTAGKLEVAYLRTLQLHIYAHCNEDRSK